MAEGEAAAAAPRAPTPAGKPPRAPDAVSKDAKLVSRALERRVEAENPDALEDGADGEEEIPEFTEEEVRLLMQEEEDGKGGERLTLPLVAKRNVPPTRPTADRASALAAVAELTHIRVDRERLDDLEGGALEAMREACTNLYLQHNRLTTIAPLAAFQKLRFLTVAHNRLERLAGLEALPGLMLLDATHNRVDSAASLVDDLPPSLVFLLVNGNPCVAHEGAACREALAAALPRLKELDGSTITAEEREVAREAAGVDLLSDEEDDDRAERELAGPSGRADGPSDRDVPDASEDLERLKAIMPSLTDGSADVGAEVQASIVDEQLELRKVRERAVGRSRMRMEEERQNDIALSGQLRDLKFETEGKFRHNLGLAPARPPSSRGQLGTIAGEVVEEATPMAPSADADADVLPAPPSADVLEVGGAEAPEEEL